MNLHINGRSARVILSELHVEFEWLRGLRCFRVKSLSHSEAWRLARALREKGLTVSADDEVFGSGA